MKGKFNSAPEKIKRVYIDILGLLDSPAWNLKNWINLMFYLDGLYSKKKKEIEMTLANFVYKSVLNVVL